MDKSVNELTVEFLLDRYELQDAGDYIRLMIPEANYPTSSGAPSLPSLEFKIGIPPDGDVSYTILSTSQKELTLDKRIQPVPYLESGQTVSEYRYEIDEAQYNRAYEPLLKSLGTYLFRSHPFIPILINPVDYDGHNNLRLTTSALIRISIKEIWKQKNPALRIPLPKHTPTAFKCRRCQILARTNAWSSITPISLILPGGYGLKLIKRECIASIPPS